MAPKNSLLPRSKPPEARCIRNQHTSHHCLDRTSIIYTLVLGSRVRGKCSITDLVQSDVRLHTLSDTGLWVSVRRCAFPLHAGQGNISGNLRPDGAYTASAQAHSPRVHHSAGGEAATGHDTNFKAHIVRCCASRIAKPQKSTQYSAVRAQLSTPTNLSYAGSLDSRRVMWVYEWCDGIFDPLSHIGYWVCLMAQRLEGHYSYPNQPMQQPWLSTRTKKPSRPITSARGGVIRTKMSCAARSPVPPPHVDQAPVRKTETVPLMLA